MKTVKKIFLLLFVGVFTLSCSNEESEQEVSLIGEWELTEWRIGIEADINNDGVSSFNLLNEIECNSQELITFDAENNISLIVEENPKLFLTENSETGEYQFHLTCSEGVIGTAATYTFENDTVEAFNSTYLKDNNVLTETIEYAIEIYNEDLTEAIGLLNSVKVYTKVN